MSDSDRITKLAYELANQRYEIIDQFLKVWLAINWDGKSDLKDFINAHEIVEAQDGNRLSWYVQLRNRQ